MRTERDVPMPRRATKGSAGFDFFAPEDIVIKAGEWTEVNSGVFLSDHEMITTSLMVVKVDGTPDAMTRLEVAMDRWVFVVVPKSGLGFKYAVRLANTAGIIDSDYVKPTDEIRAKLTADEDITIKKGEKYMQGIFLAYGVPYDEIQPTESRNGGFGSTGA